MSDLLYVNLAQLQASEDNLRRDAIGIKELADSIAANGLLQPLLVRPNGTGDTYIVTAGHRRYAALQLLDETGVVIDIPVLLRELDNEATTKAMVVENIQRQELSPTEEAIGYRRLVDMGLNQRDIAAQVGVNQSHVSKRLKLLDLDPKVQRLVDEGKLGMDDALKLGKLPEAMHLELAREAIEGRGYKIENAIAGQARQMNVDKLTRKVEQAGFTVDEGVGNVRTLDTFTSIEELTAATLPEGASIVVRQGYSDDNAVIAVVEPSYVKPEKAEPGDEQAKAERARKRAEKTARAEREGQIMALVKRAPIKDTTALVLGAFWSQNITTQLARKVCELLQLQAGTIKVPDLRTGEITEEVDYFGTVDAYYQEGDKQSYRALLALMVVRGGVTVQNWLYDSGIPTVEQLMEQATVEG